MSIRVMIVDDSAFIRRAVRRILGEDPDLVVVGEASDGASALREVERLGPDVVTLDLRMPGLDGVETLEHLMAARPTPVVLLSSYAQVDAALTVRALAAGAVDFVDKSRVSTMNVYELGQELVGKLKAAAASHPLRSSRRGERTVWPGSAPAAPPAVVVLGASTGGPAALEIVLAGLPADSRLAVLVVQHMPRGFTGALARRLSVACHLPVREARDGDALAPGRVLVAPGGHELRVVDGGDGPVLRIEDAQARALPRLDTALEGLAEVCGPAVCAVVLTGMGTDGLAGARRVREAGGTVIAEAASTCVLYGMPRAIAEAGLASCIAPVDAIGALLHRMAGERRASS